MAIGKGYLLVDHSLYRNVKIAYGGQKAWLLNATVQENILFGKALDTEKYEKMLDICALRLDLDSLPARDHTEIGEKVWLHLNFVMNIAAIRIFI